MTVPRLAPVLLPCGCMGTQAITSKRLKASSRVPVWGWRDRTKTGSKSMRWGPAL
jgi:hypothetical protein